MKIIRIREQIKEVDQESRFSRETWDAVDIGRRKVILQQYTDEMARIMGVSIGQVNFEDWDYPPNRLGFYSHGGSTRYDLPERTAWVNPSSFDPANDGQDRQPSFEAVMSVVRHEVRHAYQHSILDDAVSFPPQSRFTIRGLDESLGSNYTSPPDPLPKGPHLPETKKAYREQRRDYRNQISEVDAFAFGRGHDREMIGWLVVDQW